MKKTLASIALAALFAVSAMADGNITIVNYSGKTLEVEAFDWNDGALIQPRSIAEIARGSIGSVSCWKGLADKNAPGCKISIDTSDNIEVARAKKLNSGLYRVNSSLALGPLEVSEVAIQKGRLPKPGGGTTDCIDKGTDAVLANNGIATLQWRSDGNLVLFDRQGIQWITGTDSDAAKMCFQGDGNLVIYRKNHDPWATGTDGHGVALKLQRDCNVVIQDANGSTVWQAGTECRFF